MKNKIRLSIPKPCNANWNEMASEGQGRFCDHCQYTVIDFTKMTEAEIKDYFQNNYGTKTCGRFNACQLEDTKSETTSFWARLSDKTGIYIGRTSIKSFLFAGLAILAFITGCRRQPHPPLRIELMGEPVYREQPDTIKTTPIQKNPLK